MPLVRLFPFARMFAWVRRPRCVSLAYRSVLILLAGLALLRAAGCSGGEAPAPQPAKPEAAQPPEQVTGHHAFQNMFVAARSWAADARPFHLRNFYLKQFPGVEGRAVAWTASFASPSLRKYKPYTYSTVKTDNLPKGVFAGHDVGYRAESELTGPLFSVAGFRMDSDQAFEVAEAKGGKAFRVKHPEAPVSFLLQYDSSYHRLVWRVCYDVECSTSPFTVSVDASTGAFMKVAK